MTQKFVYSCGDLDILKKCFQWITCIIIIIHLFQLHMNLCLI